MQGETLRCASIEDSAADLRKLGDIDARALGMAREKHHRFLRGDGARGVLFHAGDDCVGYAYISSGGHIGPLAVARPDAAGAAFRTALGLAADGSSSQVSAFVPGISEAALSIAFGLGMRITFPMLIMSARPFGDWTCYLPRNPGFM
jgi:hypothetical protein